MSQASASEREDARAGDAGGLPPAPANPPGPGHVEPPPRDRGAVVRAVMFLLAVTAVVVVIDQWTKHWAQTDLQVRPGRRVVLVDGYAALTYVRNPGAAWGFLAQADRSFRRPFFITVSLLAMVFILVIYARLGRGQAWLRWALALIMSGAVGNFIDRLRYDYVVDFLDVHLRDAFHWPKFNVADVAITVGVAMLLLEMVLGPWWRQRAGEDPVVAPGPAALPATDRGDGPEPEGER